MWISIHGTHRPSPAGEDGPGGERYPLASAVRDGAWEREAAAVAGILRRFDHSCTARDRDAVSRIDGAVEAVAGPGYGPDHRRMLVDAWTAALDIYGRGRAGIDTDRFRHRLALVLAEMLCSPPALSREDRRTYWELLEAQLRYFGWHRAVEWTTLVRLNPRFRTWMSRLRKEHPTAPSWMISRARRTRGSLAPVTPACTLPPYNSDWGDIPLVRREPHSYPSPSLEAQLLGNIQDH
ncbi:hypothetical protein HER39_17490, partial [Arthrobacter deserti]|nr:hypothetical protein [Arthrobacter deserti]